MSTRVDYYITAPNDPKGFKTLACRLAEKAFGQKLKVYIFTNDGEESMEIDNLLWTFKQNSFIPHEVLENDTAPSCPVIVGHDNAPEQHNDVLININQHIPAFAGNFERIIEVVDNTNKKESRLRYKQYKTQGYEINTHELSL